MTATASQLPARNERLLRKVQTLEMLLRRGWFIERKVWRLAHPGTW